MRFPVVLALAALAAAGCCAQSLQPVVQGFIEDNCADCHDSVSRKGGLDLESLKYQPADPANFARWVKIHDRVLAHQMPPKQADQPERAELTGFLASLSHTLTATETAHDATDGRATERRLNRYEYENTLRDLLQAPWLQIRDSLPEDGEAYRFNKVGDALDMSYVQLARYIAAAGDALRQVIPQSVAAPPTVVRRYYARDQGSWVRPMKFSVFNQAPERATFPVLGFGPQPAVRAGTAPISVGAANPAVRDQEAMGVVSSAYEPIEPKFDRFRAPVSGHYRLRFSGYTIWVGPGKQQQRWYVPNPDDISRGRRSEPVTIYSEAPPRQLRRLGAFDLTPDPTVHELDVYLLAGETVRHDATRLFRSRPGAQRFHNPLAEPDGQPGVALRWLEVEGPIIDAWPTPAQRLLFGDLPARKPPQPKAPVQFVSAHPLPDAERLIARFEAAAYRRPVGPAEVRRFLPVVTGALRTGSNFTDAMLAAYTAILVSPDFLNLAERPGRLDDYALAERLSYFLWNSAPDARLRALAAAGRLGRSDVLARETDRLLADPRSRRFVDAFLDYWLDLRKVIANAPDSTLYPDYYLDDALTEAAIAESQLYFAELVRRDLPAREVVASDFAMVNERLAQLYGLPAVAGVELRPVALPPGSPRGGFMTQAAVLKVTANGTTTSPVVRGAWIMERILGQPPPPPPPNLPAIEPDTRGAATIREQLARHRTQATCAACHARIDPAGFALESFDVMGGWRDRYRAVVTPPPGAAVSPAADDGIGHGGQHFAFRDALPVDCGGQLWDGRKFGDIRGLKSLLETDEAQLARNLTGQLVVYATGAPVRFSDRPQVEAILRQTRSNGYGVRSLISALIQSDLFRDK